MRLWSKIDELMAFASTMGVISMQGILKH